MTNILLIIYVLCGISIFLHILNIRNSWLCFILSKLVIISFFGSLICVILNLFGFRFKGYLITSFMGLTFICGTILLFGLTINRRTKLLTGLITIPTILIGLLSLVFRPLILLLMIPYVIFEPPWICN